MTPTKIKVKVADLINAIEARKAEAQAEYDARVANYPTELAEFQKKALEQIDELRAKVVAGEFAPGNYANKAGERQVSIPWHIVQSQVGPWEPNPAGPNLSQFDRDIAILKMCGDEVIAISKDDNYASYIR